MDFARYSVDDFVGDESFQAYAAAPDSAAGRAWQTWLREHPEKQAEAAEAFAFVQGLRQARPHELPADLLPREVARLRQALRAPAARPHLRTRRRVRLLAGGALALLMLVLAGLRWWPGAGPAVPPAAAVRYATGADQQRTLTLPDGSQVVLNANSTLTTAARWAADRPREVWLTGEGYFRVTHRTAAPDAAVADAPAEAKFVVHAGALTVAVLGTQFDVNSRAGSTKVVLSEGRVAVERPRRLAAERLLLQPGDLVETSAAQPALRRRRVQPALYAGWTQGRLRFEQTSFREVVQLLRDSYGLRVEVADSALLRQTVFGEVPTANPDVLLTALSKSLNLKVERRGNLVRFLPARRP